MCGDDLDDKVITTVVIGSLGDHTYCARSAFTRFELRQKLYDKCALVLTFSTTSNRLAEIFKGDFSTPWFGGR